MAVFLERMDSAPVQANEFSFEFSSWTANLIDSLNEFVQEVENLFNEDFGPQSYTTAEITAMAADARDGVIWYCSDHVPPCFVGKVNGALVQLLTAAFP